eukprot:1159439-Pelagomonas_calceolata.AAC.7
MSLSTVASKYVALHCAQVRHTEMNVNSSRSHAILQLLIEQWPGQAEGPAAAAGTVSSHGVNGEAAGPAGMPQTGGSRAGGMVVRSKVNFIDLAGSERWNKVGSTVVCSNASFIRQHTMQQALERVRQHGGVQQGQLHQAAYM